MYILRINILDKIFNNLHHICFQSVLFSNSCHDDIKRLSSAICRGQTTSVTINRNSVLRSQPLYSKSNTHWSNLCNAFPKLAYFTVSSPFNQINFIVSKSELIFHIPLYFCLYFQTFSTSVS